MPTCRVMAWAQPSNVWIVSGVTVNSTIYGLESSASTSPQITFHWWQS